MYIHSNEDRRHRFFSALLCFEVLVLLYTDTATVLALDHIAVSPPCEFMDSPHWNSVTKSVYYVDRTGGTVNRYDEPADKTYSAAIIGFTLLAFILPIAKKPDKFLIGDASVIKIITWDGISEDPINPGDPILVGDGLDIIASAKADAQGRVFINMKQGGLYSVGPDKIVKEQIPTIGGFYNEFTWNSITEKLFRTDAFSILEYTYNPNTGVVDPKGTVLLRFEDVQITDLIGGLVADANGDLLSVASEKNYAAFISVQEKKIMSVLKLEDVSITSMVFGSETLDVLYVTTRKDDKYPNSGSLFRVTGGLATKGIAGVSAVLNV